MAKKVVLVCLLFHCEWEFVCRSNVCVCVPKHQTTSPCWSIKENQTLLSLRIRRREIRHEEEKLLCSNRCWGSACFSKLLSWLTRHWTSRLCLIVTANVSRCLFGVWARSLIYAWDDNATLHVILQEREESITNGIRAWPALLFPLGVPPRFSADMLTSAEHRLRAHTVCHSSFSSITAGPAGLSPLYPQLGKLTRLNSESFWKYL